MLSVAVYINVSYFKEARKIVFTKCSLLNILFSMLSGKARSTYKCGSTDHKTHRLDHITFLSHFSNQCNFAFHLLLKSKYFFDTTSKTASRTKKLQT